MHWNLRSLKTMVLWYIDIVFYASFVLTIYHPDDIKPGHITKTTFLFFKAFDWSHHITLDVSCNCTFLPSRHQPSKRPCHAMTLKAKFLVRIDGIWERNCKISRMSDWFIKIYVYIYIYLDATEPTWTFACSTTRRVLERPRFCLLDDDKTGAGKTKILILVLDQHYQDRSK